MVIIFILGVRTSVRTSHNEIALWKMGLGECFKFARLVSNIISTVVYMSHLLSPHSFSVVFHFHPRISISRLIQTVLPSLIWVSHPFDNSFEVSDFALNTLSHRIQCSKVWRIIDVTNIFKILNASFWIYKLWEKDYHLSLVSSYHFNLEFIMTALTVTMSVMSYKHKCSSVSHNELALIRRGDMWRKSMFVTNVLFQNGHIF